MELSFWLAILILTKFCLYTCSFMTIGTAIFSLIFKNFETDIKSIINISAVGAIISSIGFLLVQTGYIMEDGLAGMFDTEMLQIFLEEKIGTSLYMRVAGIILLSLGINMQRQPKWLLAIPIVMIAASFAMVGHASGDDFIYTAILLTIHLLAVSFWLGALMPLYLATNTDYAAEILERFGRMAAFIVPVLLVVGVLFAVNIVGSVSALFGSSYGITLLSKVVFVAILLGLATLNKMIFTPQIAAKKPSATLQLKRVIKLEALAFATIFMATAILTTSVTLPE